MAWSRLMTWDPHDAMVILGVGECGHGVLLGKQWAYYGRRWLHMSYTYVWVPRSCNKWGAGGRWVLAQSILACPVPFSLEEICQPGARIWDDQVKEVYSKSLLLGQLDFQWVVNQASGIVCCQSEWPILQQGQEQPGPALGLLNLPQKEISRKEEKGILKIPQKRG